MESSIGPQADGGADAERGLGRLLGRVSELFALAGGAIVIALVLMTVISIAGRYFFNLPVKGDFEITEIGCGIAVFLFFPYTQYTGQNLIAEFFTTSIPDRVREGLDAVHTLIFAVIAGFLAWRLFEGLLDKIASAERTMLVGIPIWWGYVAAVASTVLLTLICLWGAARLGFGKRV